MKLDIYKRLHAVDRLLERTTDKRHRTIVNNFLRHATLEVCGLWEGILIPEMTVEHPVYRFHTPEGFTLYDGMDAVRRMYIGFVEEGSTVMYHTDAHVAVTDEGMFFEYVNNRYFKGAALLRQGIDVDDPKADYMSSHTNAMFWPYDERCRMIGEHVYRGNDRKIRRLDPSEVITQEDCRTHLLPRAPRLEDCYLPG
ncbi:hypothetical protein [Pseudorhodoferax sp.]|uniref:hypothetical protein n=1 Tax=Pseudorhodoferax sp. TaxID=1993553 RepID=UPI002DD635D2|nr:hypothetical protein [Pseudorhodoferax sp.]